MSLEWEKGITIFPFPHLVQRHSKMKNHGKTALLKRNNLQRAYVDLSDAHMTKITEQKIKINPS